MEATLADANTILEFKDLKTYFFLENGTVRAVDGVNFSLSRKTTPGLVGESGCGKSITAMSIMRLIQSPPGKIVEAHLIFRRAFQQLAEQKGWTDPDIVMEEETVVVPAD